MAQALGFALFVAAASPAHADGGRGGNLLTHSGGGGGTGFQGASGGNGSGIDDSIGSGGGGGAAGGGKGGAGGGSGAGGAGGTGPATPAQNGASGDAGGGGGGGGYNGNGNTLQSITNSGVLTGGDGGSGGNGLNGLGSGGGGGAGGYGAVTMGASSNSGTIAGGNGGNGGGNSGSSQRGNGGDGGVGVYIGAASGGVATLTNQADPESATPATITGGNGGNGAAGGKGGVGVNFAVSGGTLFNGGTITGGNGNGAASAGAGVTGAGLTIINTGTIAGGTAPVQANAITFTSGNNSLELRQGYSFTGDVVANGTGTNLLRLAGDAGSGENFDVSRIGATLGSSASAYQGFTAFEKTGDSIWTLTNSTTATTPWAITGGTLVVAQDGSLGASAGGLSLDNGTLQWNAAFDFAATRSVTLGASGGTFDTNGHDAAIPHAIDGLGGLTKKGAGTLTLMGVNTYMGGTTINAGTLALGSGGSLAAIGGLSLAGSGAIFDISASGANQTIGSLSGVAGSTVALGDNSLTFGDTTNQTFAGGITGTGGIVKQGNGTQTLMGANTYTGGTTINAGTLAVADSGSLAASGALNLAGAGATFDMSGAASSQTVGALSGAAGSTIALGGNSLTFGDSTDQTLAGAITGTGGIVKQGAGVETLSGASTYSGGTTLNAGGLVVGSNPALGTGTLTVGGAATLDSSTAIELGNNIVLNSGLTVLGSNDLTLDGSLSGTGGLTKDGSATLTLNGTNTYTGGTQVNAGTLALGANASLSAGGIVDVATGATFDLSAGNGLQIFGTLIGGGAIVLGANTLTLGDATDGIFSGAIAGSGGLIKEGTGTETLTGANTFTGGTSINSGTLGLGAGGSLAATGAVTMGGPATGFDISAAGADQTIGALNGAGGNVTLGANTLTFGDAANQVFGGVISGTGGIVKQGAGRETLLNTHTYTGGTTIEAGTLALAGFGSLMSSGAVKLAGMSAAFDISGTVGSQTIGALAGVAGSTIALGDNTLTFGDATNQTLASAITGTGGLVKQGAGVTTLSGSNTYSGGTTLNAGGLVVGSNSALGTNTVTVGGPATLDSSSAVTLGNNMVLNAGLTVRGSHDLALNGTLSGIGGLTKDGTATLTLNGANTFEGGTQVNAGTLALGANASLWMNGVVNVATGATFDLSAGNGHQQFGTLTGGGMVNLGANVLTVGDSTDGIFDGAIGGSGGLVKTGTGKETLTSASTYTGATAINAGTLALGGAGSLSATTNVNLTNAGVTFDIATATGTPTVGSLSGVGGSNVTLGGNMLTLGGGSDGSFAGTISGGGGLVKTGPGTQMLLSANTYTGGTTLSGGTLTVGNDAALGTGAVTVTAAGTLDAAAPVHLANPFTLNAAMTFGGSADATLSGVVSGSSGLIKNGSAELLLAGDNTYAGGTAINAGTLTLMANHALGTGGLTMNGGTLNLGGSGPALTDVSLSALSGVADAAINLGSANLTINGGGTFAGTLDGAGSLTKDGTDTLTLSGTNTYSGATTVRAGTLAMNGSAANSSMTVQSGGTLAGSGSVGGLIVEDGGSAVAALSNAASAGTAMMFRQFARASVFAAAQPGSQGLSVLGNATFERGSILQVAATPQQSGTLTVGGGATLQGGQVRVLADQGVYSPSMDYTILAAAGGVNGTFDSATSNLVFLTPQLNYDATHVYMQLQPNGTSFSSVATTPNQRAVAGAVDALPASGTLVSALLSTDAATARSAFNMLDGEIHASTSSMLLADSHYLRDALTDRLREGLAPADGPLAALSAGSTICDSRVGQGAAASQADAHTGSHDACVNGQPYRPVVWIQGYGATGRMGGGGNTSSLDRHTEGFVTGADMALNNKWRVGVASGYAHSSPDNDINSSASVDSYHLAMYSGAQYGPVGVRLGASYTWSDIGTDRSPAFAGFADHNKADYAAQTAQVFGEVGYAVPLNRFALEPFANVAYVNLHTDSFTEGGGDAALHGAGQTSNTGFSTLGSRIAVQLGETSRGAVSAHAMAGWRHAFGTVQNKSTLTFVSGGPAFGVTGVPVARDSAVVELGVDAHVAKNLTLGIAYGGQYGGGSRDNAISGQAAWAFTGP